MKRLVAAILLAALPAASGVYLVLLKGASALSFVSAEGKVEATIPVGQHPHEMAFSPDRKLLYTTDNGTMRIEHAGSGGNTVSIIDLATRKKIGEIALGQYRRPHGIDVDPSTGMIAVSTELPDQLLILDPNKRAVVKHFDTKGKTSHMVKFGPGAKWAYVSNAGSGNVSAINLSNGEVKLIETGERPEGSVLARDGKELYVCNREGASITVIDTSTNSAVARIATGKGPVRVTITPDGGTLVYALMHEKKVAFANPRTRQQTDYVLVPAELVSCNLSQDGSVAFASGETTDNVYMVSLKTKKIVGELKLTKDSGPDPVFEAPSK